MRIVCCDSISEFVKIGFADEDGAGFLKLGPGLRIVQGNEIFEDFRAGGCADSFGVDVIFQRDGDSVERATVAVALAAAWGEEFGFGFFGLGQGEFGGDRDVGVYFGIELLDAREDQFRYFDWRDFSFAVEAGYFFYRGEGQVGIGHREQEKEFNTEGVEEAQRLREEKKNQKIFSWWRRFPKVPMLAMMKAMRNWLSVRTWPSSMRRYSRARPQHLPL